MMVSVMYEGVFAQLEYNQDKLSAFVSVVLQILATGVMTVCIIVKIMQSLLRKNYLGGNIKGGANYNLTENHNVFVNAGYINRAPMFDTSFINSQTSHDRNPDAKNEKTCRLSWDMVTVAVSSLPI